MGARVSRAIHQEVVGCENLLGGHRSAYEANAGPFPKSGTSSTITKGSMTQAPGLAFTNSRGPS